LKKHQQKKNNMGLPFTDNLVALNAVTADVANTAATPFDVSKRQKMSIQFTCAGHSSGNGVFGVEVSNDGVNWVVYNRLIANVAGDNTKTDAKSAAPTLSTNTSSIYFFPEGDYFKMIRVFIDVTTDGAYSAIIECAG
jgi:hypothetical protein